MADAGNDSVGTTDTSNGPLGVPLDEITVAVNCPDISAAVYSKLLNSTLTTTSTIITKCSHIFFYSPSLSNMLTLAVVILPNVTPHDAPPGDNCRNTENCSVSSSS